MIYTDGTHVITDQQDLTELHEFAHTKLGFPRRWFQDKPGQPHYDTMSLSKKLAALAGGAKSVTSKRIVEILQEREAKAGPTPWINESSEVDIATFDALVPPTNEALNRMECHAGKQCHYCERAYPQTVLNIEAVIHHNAKHYACLDHKACRRARRKKHN